MLQSWFQLPVGRDFDANASTGSAVRQVEAVKQVWHNASSARVGAKNNNAS